MVHDTSNTAGGEKTGRSADSNDPTSGIHACARAEAVFPLFTGNPRFSPAESVTINGFAFVPSSVLFGAVALLTDAEQTLRNAASRFGDADEGGMFRVCDDAADKIKVLLLDDATPRDPIVGLALSLVQDLGEAFDNSRMASGSEWIGDEAWASFDRLRDALEEDSPLRERPGWAAGVIREPGTGPDEEVADPAATVRTIEAAVAGGLIPGIDANRLATARVGGRLFGKGGSLDLLTADPGVDTVVVDALRQSHDETAAQGVGL